MNKDVIRGMILGIGIYALCILLGTMAYSILSGWQRYEETKPICDVLRWVGFAGLPPLYILRWLKGSDW